MSQELAPEHLVQRASRSVHTYHSKLEAYKNSLPEQVDPFKYCPFGQTQVLPLGKAPPLQVLQLSAPEHLVQRTSRSKQA